MQQRYYDPVVGRFYGNDPVGFRDIHSFNRFAYANNNPYIYKDPDGNDAVAVVFPDYKISTPIGKVSGLGHAGVLLINNDTGLTKYYEYGRYDKKGLGLVRRKTVPNVTIGKDGRPTVDALQKTLGSISKQAGKGGAISGAYVEGDFNQMNQHATNQMLNNSDPNRDPYSLTGNNCGTFMQETIEAGGADTPWMIDPTPTSYIEEMRDDFEAIDYNP